jgi:hypothetical protein
MFIDTKMRLNLMRGNYDKTFMNADKKADLHIELFSA